MISMTIFFAIAVATQDGVIAVPAPVVVEEHAPTTVSVTVPDEDEKAVAEVAKVREQFGRGDYAAGTATILMFVVWALRKLRKNGVFEKNPDALPWVALAISIAMSIAAALKAGFPIYDSAMAGLVVGMASAGCWSLVGKHILPKPTPAPVILFKESQKEDDKR